MNKAIVERDYARGTTMSEYVKEVNQSDFERVVLQSEKPVLVDFWAEWCGPCRTLAPIVEAVAEQYAKSVSVVKLNVDESATVAQCYGIRGIPTLILFQEGEEKERIVGVVNQNEISRTINRHVNGASNGMSME
jgi:thioredoxin 1